MSTPRNPPVRRTPAKAPDDTALAWELAAAARLHLSRADADRIHIAIGIGETFAAIDALITAIARERIAVGEDVLATVGTWLDCYLGQAAEPRLRQLVADLKPAPLQRIPTPEDRSRPLPSARSDEIPQSG
jgi:hypothetical protein